MADEKPEVRVRRGSIFLDKKDKDWFNKISLDLLNMNHATDGILGQLTGHFGRAPYMMSHKKYEKFGFDILDFEPLAEYDVLTKLWRAEILKRRK